LVYFICYYKKKKYFIYVLFIGRTKMPIDYLEYFAGNCFGAIGTNDEFVCDEQIGADIDAELDDHIDEELFGSAN
jgi:hypothetical protein